MTNQITVNQIINAPIQKVWEYWTSPEHIVHWNFATDEWQCPTAINDLEPEGKFSWRMEAKDGSMGFDYAGVYRSIEPFEKIEKNLDDGRLVTVHFSEQDGVTEVVENFEPDENSIDLQRQGWQAILNNFKKYVELKISRNEG